jgi:hypothetical protein
MRSCIVLAVCLVCSVGWPQADTWVVDLGGGGDFTNIQDAIDHASSGDEIVVNAGIYTENVDYLGKDLWIHSAAGPGSTTIDGGGGAPGRASCVTFATGETLAAVLEGFTITGGDGTRYTGTLEEGVDNPLVGGGVYCATASPTITGCRFVDIETDYAAAIYLNDSHPEISDCEFVDNVVGSYGGAIAGPDSKPTIAHCLFESNFAGSGDGTIHLLLPAIVEWCEFRGNQARAGAAVNCPHFGADLQIRDCIFEGNSAHGNHGGAIRVHEAGPTIERCLFIGNWAAEDGGGLLAIDGAFPTIQECTFHGNGAVRDGGNIALWYGAYASISNTIISGALANGGLFCSGSAGAGLVCNDSWDNNGGNYIGIGDPTGHDGNISADPLFCDPPIEDFTIRSDSPCAPDYNPECGLIGAYGVGCDPPTPAESVTWGSLKTLFR